MTQTSAGEMEKKCEPSVYYIISQELITNPLAEKT